MKITDIKEICSNYANLEHIHVVGWVVNHRQSSKKLGFININDGSCFENLQVVYKANDTNGFSDIQNAAVGSSVYFSGVVVATANKAQAFELVAKEAVLLSQAEEYPLQTKEHSLEYLRALSHIRHRTKYYRAIQLIRKELNRAIFLFFDQLNFMWVHTPIITQTDSEGAGEAFSVTTSKDAEEYFRSAANLTVSGQLHAEAYALGFKKVYAFGPTFRAEKSNTNRHVAEFWMLEAEVAFANMKDNLNLIENLVKFLIKHVLEKCQAELAYCHEFHEVGQDWLKKLQQFVNLQFPRITYAKAVELLNNAVINDGAQFEDSHIVHGMELKTEHEKYLAEVIFQGPVFVTDYPKAQKAFYMKVNDDQTTVAASDLLVPKIGELVGGSERESAISVLKSRCLELAVPTDSLTWYLDLRKYGYYRSAGFGLGFDRLLMLLTRAENIRDVIPFARAYQHLRF